MWILVLTCVVLRLCVRLWTFMWCVRADGSPMLCSCLYLPVLNLVFTCVVLRLFGRLRTCKWYVEDDDAVYASQHLVILLLLCGLIHWLTYAPRALMYFYLMANVSLRGCPGTDV